jgi:hypothetical protein
MICPFEGGHANERDAAEPASLHVTTDRLHYLQARAVVIGSGFALNLGRQATRLNSPKVRPFREVRAPDSISRRDLMVQEYVLKAKLKVTSMWSSAIAALLMFVSLGFASAQQRETLYLSEAAYDPLPSPDGKVIAFVLTGRKQVGGSGGLGRSNLRSQVGFADTSGARHQDANVDGFLGEWLEDSSSVVSYRDGRFQLAGPGGSRVGGSIPIQDKPNSPPAAERVAYLSSLKTFTWIEHSGEMTVLQTVNGPIARANGMLPLSSLIVPSPDGRYLAVGGPTPYQWEDHNLWIFDVKEKTWTNLGPFTIHPDPNWDYVKPSWNPWFSDGHQLTFFSGNALYVVAPDGTARRRLLTVDHAGLAVPSKDGRSIAYVTFTPRPRKIRPDLQFWGGSTIWIVASSGGEPTQITRPNDDETYDLRWLTETSLIFDRVGDELFNVGARIWTVPVFNK